jgi:hypothetical protein
MIELITENALLRLREFAPGWDKYWLAARYTEWAKGREKPKNADEAFWLWAVKVTGGCHPDDAKIDVDDAIEQLDEVDAYEIATVGDSPVSSIVSEWCDATKALVKALGGYSFNRTASPRAFWDAVDREVSEWRPEFAAMVGRHICKHRTNSFMPTVAQILRAADELTDGYDDLCEVVWKFQKAVGDKTKALPVASILHWLEVAHNAGFSAGARCAGMSPDQIANIGKFLIKKSEELRQ